MRAHRARRMHRHDHEMVVDAITQRLARVDAKAGIVIEDRGCKKRRRRAAASTIASRGALAERVERRKQRCVRVIRRRTDGVRRSARACVRRAGDATHVDGNENGYTFRHSIYKGF